MTYFSTQLKARIEQNIGYRFKDKSLLDLALTHRSFGGDSYERLEFLGDSVLGFIISEKLYQTYPNLKEGKLSRIRAQLISGKSLQTIGETWRLNNLVHTKNQVGEKSHLPDSVLADLVESITGAIYLDSHIDICRQQVLCWFESKFAKLNPDDVFKDAKTQLQEWLQAQQMPLPDYQLSELSSTDGKHLFAVNCVVSCLPKPIYAEGKNRREAEQKAAQKALKLITQL